MKKFNVYCGGFGAAVTLAVLVILAELIKPFKELLKSVFWHHWVGKLVLLILAFLIIGYLYKEKEMFMGVSVEKASWYAVLASLTVILLFYIIHYFV